MWSCSPYDSIHEQYAIPYFGELEDLFQYQWQNSNEGVSYVYDINENELNCTGVITGIGFCFTASHNFHQLSSTDLFNFHIIATNSTSFTVTQSISVTVIPSQSMCRETLIGEFKCCDKMDFEQQYYVNLSSPNLSFGVSIVPFSLGRGILQGFYENTDRQFVTMIGEFSFPLSYGMTYLKQSFNDRSLRTLWLNVGKKKKNCVC